MARELSVREMNARTTSAHFKDRAKPGLVRVSRSDKLIVQPEHAAYYSKAGCNVTYSRDGQVCIVTVPRKRSTPEVVTVQSGMVKLGKGKSGPMTRKVTKHSPAVYNPAPIMASPVDERVYYRKAVTE